MENYEKFLEKKKHLIGDFGFEPIYIPEMAFDFQKMIIEKAIKKGRMAIFADTGLGKTLIEHSKSGCISPLTKSYYTNTSHRQYLSRWLEAVISAYSRYRGWRCEKPYDKGRKVKSKQGKEIWVRTRYSRRGEADIMLIALGQVWNIEVKVGQDRMSEAQIQERFRAIANNERYEVVRTLEDWWLIVDEIGGPK